MGGVFPIYYNITWSSETPKLYYIIYEQPLTKFSKIFNSDIDTFYKKEGYIKHPYYRTTFEIIPCVNLAFKLPSVLFVHSNDGSL